MAPARFSAPNFLHSSTPPSHHNKINVLYEFNDCLMEDMDEKTVGSIFFANDEYVPRSRLSRAKRQLRVVTIFASACLLLLVFSLHGRQYVYHPNAFSAPAYYVQESLSNPFEQFQNCSITNFVSTYLPFLSTASPLHVSEFIQRRNNLAKALITDEIDAFIVEPGYTFQYYANISRKDWEVWEPEERPFLMIVQPVISEESRAAVKTRTVFLAPIFEVERVRLLGMPFEEELKIVPWEEHENPYVVLRKAWSGLNVNGGQKLDGRARKPKIMVDEEMRDFIQRGLGENGFKVVGLGGEVERVRQTKSEREIGILRAVNTGTVEAVRAMRECMQPGLTENEVMVVLDNTLRAGGLEPFFDIVLFGKSPSSQRDSDEISIQMQSWSELMTWLQMRMLQTLMVEPMEAKSSRQRPLS